MREWMNEDPRSQELVRLRRQVDDLATINNRRAVDDAIAEGKLSASQREWALDYAGQFPRQFEMFLASAPAIHAPADPRDDAVAQFKAKADEIRKADSTIDEHEARRRASREHPELFAAAMGR